MSKDNGITEQKKTVCGSVCLLILLQLLLYLPVCLFAHLIIFVRLSSSEAAHSTR